MDSPEETTETGQGTIPKPQQIADSWMAAIFDRSQLGIIQTDQFGNVLYVNPKANEICGYDDLRTKDLQDLFPDGESYQLLQGQLAARRQGLSDEYEIDLTRGTDRRRVPVLVSSVPVISKSEEVLGAISIVRSLEIERARLAFATHISDAESGTDLLRRIAQETQKVIPFDLLRVNFFTQDVSHARVVFEYPRTLEQSSRWVPISTSVRDLTLNRKPARHDLRKFLGTGQEGVESLLRTGLLWSMRHPVYRQNRLVGSVSIFTKAASGFSDKEFDIFSRLPLDTALAGVVFFDTLEQLRFTFDLAKRISECETEAEIFWHLTGHLSSHYGWTHVAVFTVDEIEDCLVLRSQFSLDESRSLPEPYTQPLTEGVLGYVIETGEDVLITDADTDPIFRDKIFHPIPLSGNRSELCMQITADKKAFALLNIEDIRTNAFTQEEQQSLRRVLDDLGVMIESRRKAQIAAEAVRSTPTALFIIDGKGLIRDCNPAAKTLLEYSESELVGTSIAQYVADVEVGHAIAAASNPTGEIELISKRKLHIRGVVAGLPLPGSVNRRMITFRDTTVQHRSRQLDYLVGIYAQLAREIKPSLSIVGACLRDIKGLDGTQSRKLLGLSLSSSKVTPLGETVDLITEQLRHVESMLDRAMLLESGKSVASKCRMIIYAPQFVGDLLSRLPVAERDAIEFQQDTHSYVMADPAQLDLVLRTILGYFLRFRKPSGKVTVLVASRTGTVLFHFTGFCPTNPARSYRGDDDLAIAEAFLDMSLSEPYLSQTIQDHGGRLQDPAWENGILAIGFNLPTSGDLDA